MMRKSILAAGAVAAVSFLCGAAAMAAGPSKAVTAAVGDSARPQADRDRDAIRKPAETVAFAGIKPGDRIVELIPGSGYYTRILSVVVGPKGHVFAVPPPKRPNAPEGSPDPAAGSNALAADPHYGNVSVLTQKISELTVPEPVDVVWTSENYHDFHNGPTADIAAFNKTMFNLLKPGGTFIVEDHAAAPGSGADVTSKLHRSDPETSKAELTAAGFVFVAKGDFLKNPDDPHTAPVFDASVRGKTDKYILKFMKPKK
jgi:predicted methyltransferase